MRVKYENIVIGSDNKVYYNFSKEDNQYFKIFIIIWVNQLYEDHLLWLWLNLLALKEENWMYLKTTQNWDDSSTFNCLFDRRNACWLLLIILINCTW